MRIAMVSTRFAGLDGVSLEAAKVAEALARAGHEIVWWAGELGSGFSPGMEVPSAFFGTDENLELERAFFGGGDPDALRSVIDVSTDELVEALDHFVADYRPDVFVVQNAWAIPMQLPLARALTEVCAAHGLPAVGHHHDFAWERERFSNPAIPEMLDRYFPPVGDRIGHVVINQDARDELATRRGATAEVLPNVMDFATGPPPSDGGESFREKCGLSDGETILLQPTRVIPRKGIELSIELASRMSNSPVLVVTHPDDLDVEYWARLQELAIGSDVDLRLVDAGRSSSALASAYAAADLVCFPSLYEGYGNALVEAIFFERPLFVNRYSVFVRDIARYGISGIEIDGAVTDEAVECADRWVEDPTEAQTVIDANTAAGRRHLSYDAVIEAFGRAFGAVDLTI